MTAWIEPVVSEERLLLPGHSACAGCGPAINVRHVLGGPCRGDTRIEDRPRRSGVLLDDHRRRLAGECVRRDRHLTPFASAAAEACGIKAALRLRGVENAHVVVWAGDGSTCDIGFSGVSAAAERNEDILYVLNDNEAYMNTGVQKSGATPEGAWTTTTPATPPRRREEGHRPHSLRARDPLRRDPGCGSVPMLRDFSARSRGPPSSKDSGSSTSSAHPPGWRYPPRSVDGDHAARGRVAVLPSVRVRRRQLEHHLQTQASGARPRVPPGAGRFGHSVGAGRSNPGPRRRTLEVHRLAGGVVQASRRSMPRPVPGSLALRSSSDRLSVGP